MSLKISILVVLLSLKSSIFACDVCNLYMGVMPNERKHRLEFLYRRSTFGGYINLPPNSYGVKPATQPHPWLKAAHAADTIAFDASKHFSSQDYEVFQNFEIRGLFFVHPRFSVLAVLPFSLVTKKEAGKNISQRKGLDDANIVTSFYPIWKNKANYGHRLSLNLGVKIPSGDALTSGFVTHLNTGAWGWLLGIQHVSRYKSLGLSSLLTWRFNQKNKQGYHFSDAGNVAFNAFYQFNYKDWVLMPMTGIWFEHSEGEYNAGRKVPNTGGDVLFTNLGLDIYFKQIGFSLQYQIPTYQSLHVYGPRLGNGARLIAGLNFSFGSAWIRGK
jgi:hypothetical protein